MGARRIAVAGAIVLLGACSSPEATRMRAGGPGADVGNVRPVVELHGGARPYHDTPRLIEPHGLQDVSAARHADRAPERADERRGR